MMKRLFTPESAARVNEEILRLLETPRTRKEIATALGYALWRLTSDQQRLDAIFSDAEHNAWMAYWSLPRAQRQQTASPTTWRAHRGMQ